MSYVDKLKRGLSDVLTVGGRQSLLERFSDRLAAQVQPSLRQCHVLPSDVVAAGAQLRIATSRPGGGPLRIGWIISPPSAGSGGHTTAFRMVRELERAGHHCDLVLYDLFGGSVSDREAVIRRAWPELKAGVRSLDAGLDGLDACVATGWQSAYALAARSAHMDIHRFYFIQDFEPFFYPHGYEYALAEATYSLDMTRIALGEMVSLHVRNSAGSCHTVPFGCDTDNYRLLEERGRDGVVFYARSGTTRRGFLLASMGLEEFHRRRPKVPIKAFGPLGREKFSFPIAWKGLLTPSELNGLYNTSVAGLGMSFTNVSLVVGEMLAAGCIPVVNDSQDGRLDMHSPYVNWVDPDPSSVADALVELVDNPPQDVLEISRSTNPGWSETQKQVAATIAQVVYGS